MENEEYKNILPKIYHNVSYETDVPEEIKKIVKEQIQNRKGLFIEGLTGVGKTYLACSIVKEVLNNGIKVKFYNTGDFLERLREEFSKKESFEEDYEGLFRETMNFDGVLIFDDIGAEKISDWTAERMYLIINKKWEDVSPMIFTSNFDLEILSARLGDRITSRIRGMTKTIRLEGEDKRQKN